MTKLSAFATAALIALPLAALPLTARADEAAIKARQSHMSLLGYNLGVLGGMAQGRIPYDAQVAARAAANLHLYSQVDTTPMWVPGTAVGSVEGTRLLPAALDDLDDFMAGFDELEMAAASMAAAAGTDLTALQGAIGGLGGACGTCHQTYRQQR